MTRNRALVAKYPNGYRDKIAYHREQGNDEKVKYFEEKQRQLDEKKSNLEITIEVFKFLGYRVEKISDSVVLCQKHPKLVSVPLSMALLQLNEQEVITKIEKAMACANKYRPIPTKYRPRKIDFMWEMWGILTSEKLI